jgi:predicted phosphodiesterase
MEINMNKNNYTRREFLKAAGMGVAAIAMPSCALKNQTFTFAQVCDTQLGFGGYEHDLKSFRQAVKHINALKTDFVVICGDLVDNPDEKSFADFNKVKAGFNMPCYCAAGNHDIGSKLPLVSLPIYRKVVDKDYYSFEYRKHTFVIVNTQLWKTPVKGESEKQDSWLEATLEAASNRRDRIFVVGHHPLFIAKPDEIEEYYNLPVAKRKILLNLFEKYGVVTVLGGHTHNLLINEYKGIQLVNAETLSKNFDKRPLGFRVWHIGDARPFKHEFFPLEGL